MSNINFDYIEDYIESLHKESTGILKKMELQAEREHIPIISKEVGQLLKILIGLKKPREILELGTATGYSALVMLKDAPYVEKLYTIERRADRVEEAKDYISQAGEADRIEIIKGDAEAILKNWSNPVDMIFMDAAKGHYESFFKLSQKILKPGGLMVCDNVLYQGMVANDDLVIRRKKTIVQRLRRFLPKLVDLEGYEVAVLPIHDGIALIRKEDEDEK